MRKSALVICNGESPSIPLALHLARRTDEIIAADGGANRARRIGITPDTIIGDLDSLTRETRKAFPDAAVVRVRRQDNTDLEKALDHLQGEGIRRVVILGMTGGRIDFTLANFISLWRYVRTMELIVGGEGWYAVPVLRKRTVRAPRGTAVSLIPFGPCRGVTLRGVEYPLTRRTLRMGEMGVSNVVRRSPATFMVERGAAFLVVLHDLRGVAELWKQ